MKKENDMKGFMNFLSGMVVGALVGASLAILLAPSSGDELRNQLQSRMDTIQTDVKQAAETRRAELEKQLAELRAPRSAD
jgi:gas vesicle protein